MRQYFFLEFLFTLGFLLHDDNGNDIVMKTELDFNNYFSKDIEILLNKI